MTDRLPRRPYRWYRPRRCPFRCNRRCSCGTGIFLIAHDAVAAIGIHCELGLLFQIGPDILDHVAWLQRLVGIECRANFHAPAAPHAGLLVEQVFPGIFLHVMDAEGLGILEHLRRHDPDGRSRRSRAEEYVRRRHEDVQELCIGHIHKETQRHEYMHPPEKVVKCPDGFLIHP